MAQGYKDFTAGAILTAADLEDYNQNQSIMRFASAAARDTALTVVKTEGMMAYLIDLNVVTVYNGSAWSTIGPVHGVGTSFDPVITQSGTVAHTLLNSSYVRLGRKVLFDVTASMTGTGTAANIVTVSLPVNISYVNDLHIIGSYMLFDNSASIFWTGFVTPASATTIKLNVVVTGVALTYLGTSSFTAALASGDAISASIVYDAAADA